MEVIKGCHGARDLDINLSHYEAATGMMLHNLHLWFPIGSYVLSLFRVKLGGPCWTEVNKPLSLMCPQNASMMQPPQVYSQGIALMQGKVSVVECDRAEFPATN